VIDDVLEQLAAGNVSPRRVLDDLARVSHALAKNDRPRPEVELFLSSGHVVRGRMVSVVDDRQGVMAMLLVGGNQRQPAVTFVRIDQVIALGVGDASLLVRAPQPDTPVPSKLELQRQIAARIDGLHAKLGRKLEINLAGTLDDDDRRAIGLLVPVLAEVLTAIAGDEMGKEALAQVHVIELGAAPSGEVRKESRGFFIRAPKLLTEQYTHATLRKDLEKQL
jgi:hypothetical protein